MSKNITDCLRDLRDTMHKCMEVYYAEDLPKMVTYSVECHKKVIKFLKFMRVRKTPLNKCQKKILSNITDIMTTAYNRDPIYRHTNIGNYEDHGFRVLHEDLMFLKSCMSVS